MANPHFGIWPSNDEACETDAFGTVPSAEEEFFERFGKRSNRDLNELMVSVATGRPVKIEDREKLILKVRSLFKGPDSFREKDWYARPFTPREAQKVLASAGIKFERITGTALSGWPDPLGESQVIEAVVAGREVHFHLQHTQCGKWKVTKVFAASSLINKTPD